MPAWLPACLHACIFDSPRPPLLQVIDAWRTGSAAKFINHAPPSAANLEARMRVGGSG